MAYPKFESIERRQLFAAGMLDTSFGNGGTIGLKAALIATSNAPITTPTQLAVDAAGRTVVASISDNTINITRLTADGVPDTRFAPATGNVIRLNYIGVANTYGEFDQPNNPPRIAIDNANRLYVLANGFVSRYTSSGKIDRSFGNRGSVWDEDIAGRFGATNFALDQSGRIWLIGYFSGEVSSAMQLARLTADGKVDSTFSPGEYTYSLADEGQQIRVLTDGSVIAVGTSQTTSEVANTVDTQTTTSVIKFKPNGQLDKTYRRNGRRTFRLSGADASSSTASPVGIRSDGAVVLYTNQNGVGEKNFLITAAGRDGGEIDFSPGSSGLTGVLRAAQFVRQADGREIVVDLERDALARFNADNTVDTTFNGGNPLGNAAAATVATDGSVLYAGTGASATDAKYYVRRVFGSEGPAARLVPSTLIAAGRQLPFRVVYRDDDGVNVNTITGNELRVVAPDGTITRAVLTGVVERNGNVIADYFYHPTDNRITSADNGVYAVRLRRGSVFDINNNAAELRTIGSLVVRMET